MTRYVTFILITSLGLTGCLNQTADKTEKEKSQLTVSLASVRQASTESIISIDTFSIPTKYFMDIVSIFDSAGFAADTNRIKKVPYYSWTIKTSNPIFLIHNIPFYKMDTVTNPVFNFIKHGTHNLHYSQVDSIRKAGLLKKACKKVKNITGFYFNGKIPSDLLQTDGFIEEWEFDNISDAQAAEAELINSHNTLSKTYYYIYFNSYAQIFRKENHLYTFYSRATWDAKLFDRLYERVIIKISADSWTTSKGQTKRKNGA